MSQNKVVALELAVDTDGSVSAMSRLTAAFEKSDSAASGLSRAATGLNQTVELAKQGWAAFSAVIIGSANAYAEEAAEVNRVRLSLQRVGIDYAAAGQAVSDYVDERARVTNLDDSGVREQLIQLANATRGLGASSEDLMEWSTLAQDVGETAGDMAKGIDLVTAAAAGKVTVLAKAIPAEKEYLMSLAKIPDVAERSSRALEFLNEQYGGQAEDLDQASLKWNQLTEAVDDTKEAFGKLILDNRYTQAMIMGLQKDIEFLQWAMDKAGVVFDSTIGKLFSFAEESEDAAAAQTQLGAAIEDVNESLVRQSRAYDSILAGQMDALTGGRPAQALYEFSEDLNTAFEDSLRTRGPIIDWINTQFDAAAGMPANLDPVFEKFSNAFQEIPISELLDAQVLVAQFEDAARGTYNATVDLSSVLDEMGTVIDGQTVSWRTAIGVYLEAQQAEMAAANTNREAASIRRSSTDDQISAMRELAEASAASAAQNIAAGAEEVAALQAHATEQARIVQYKKKLAAEAYNLAVEESLSRQDRLAQEHTAIISTADVYRSISQEIAGSITAAFAPPSDGGKPFRKIVGSMINVIGTLATIASGVYLAMPGMQGFGIALAAAAAVAYSAGAALGAGGGKRQTEAGNVSTVNSNNSSVTNIYIAGSNTGTTGRPVASAESFAMAHRQAKRLGYVAA